MIIDIGVINHIVSDISIHNSASIRKLTDKISFQLPNGENAQVTHIGSSYISKKDTLNNVLLLPQFKYNLLFVSQATKKLNCITFF